MNKNLRYYKISEPELRELIINANYYLALEAGGVDNWDWYSESIHDFISMCSDVDSVEYEDMEEIVEAELAQYPICTCQEQLSSFDELMKDLP